MSHTPQATMIPAAFSTKPQTQERKSAAARPPHPDPFQDHLVLETLPRFRIILGLENAMPRIFVHFIRSLRCSRSRKNTYLQALLSQPMNGMVAKIAGIKLTQAYCQQYGFRAISLMPTNLYGPGDNFDLASSHVLPALLRKFHEAKTRGVPATVIWATESPRRELLHVD